MDAILRFLHVVASILEYIKELFDNDPKIMLRDNSKK